MKERKADSLKPSSEIVHFVKLLNSKIPWINEFKNLVMNISFYLKILLFLTFFLFLSDLPSFSQSLAFCLLLSFFSFFLSFTHSHSKQLFFFFLTTVVDFDSQIYIKYFCLIQVKITSIFFPFNFFSFFFLVLRFWHVRENNEDNLPRKLIKLFSHKIIFPVLHQLMRRLFINLCSFMPILGLRSFLKTTLVLTS